MVQAHHCLILSGTPIQNNVLELWSLFDILMPGFLGIEAFFNEWFGKPITPSRNSKSSNKAKEAGETQFMMHFGCLIHSAFLYSHYALEALHTPSLLCLLKEDVFC